MNAREDAAELQTRLDSLWSSVDEHAFKENGTVLINELEPKMQGAIISAMARGSRRDINTYSEKTEDEVLAEDALALAQLDFWSALKKMKEARIGRITTYSRLQKYASKIATQAWIALLRKKHREWTNVHNAIDSIIKQHPEKFAIWNNRNRSGGDYLVGLVQWRHLPSVDRYRDLDVICEEVRRNAEEDPSFRGLAALDRLKMCSLVLDALRGPIGIYKLVSVITKLETQLSILPTPEPRPPWLRLHYRELFQLCWSAFLRLSIQQRRVLLLKWQDIEWFEIYCRVSIATIATALDLPLETFLDLLEKLPLSDEQISQVTSIKVQSIRNLRGESLLTFRREIEKLTGDHAGLIVSRPRSIGDAIQFDSLDSIEAI
jgi:hypothetical protein